MQKVVEHFQSNRSASLTGLPVCQSEYAINAAPNILTILYAICSSANQFSILEILSSKNVRKLGPSFLTVFDPNIIERATALSSRLVAHIVCLAHFYSCTDELYTHLCSVHLYLGA